MHNHDTPLPPTSAPESRLLIWPPAIDMPCKTTAGAARRSRLRRLWLNRLDTRSIVAHVTHGLPDSRQRSVIRGPCPCTAVRPGQIDWPERGDVSTDRRE